MLFFALLLQTLPDRDPAGESAFPRILDVAAQDSAEVRRYRLDVDSDGAALRGAWQPVVRD